MAFEITIKITKDLKGADRKGLAQQIANMVEAFTGKRTVVNVKEPISGIAGR